MRQDPRVGRHDLGAKRAHRAAARDVFVVNGLRLRVEPILDLIHRLPRLRRVGERALHPLDRPEQIHGRRTRPRHQLADLVELRREFLRSGRLALAHRERDAHGGRHANRRRAADHHRLDRARDLGAGLAADVDFLRWKLPLIDHHDRISFARNRRKHPTIL